MARQELKNAYNLCVNTQNANNCEETINLRHILKFLIPLEMMAGNFPSEELLQKHSLSSEFGALSKACMTGDIKALESELSKNMSSFLRSGLLLAISHLRYITLRNLVRKVAISVKIHPEISKNANFKDKPYLIMLT